MTINVNPQSTRIGWIGTGVMGSSMCEHIVAAGYNVSITTRTKSKAQSLLQKGAKWCETPKQLAEQCDIVFSIVGHPEDVRQVHLQSDGAVHGIKKGGVLVDMTTSHPSLAIEIEHLARGRGACALDAPVSGGDIGARNQSLSIMVGGDKSVYEALMPVWNIMGKTVVHQGPAGCGQHTKMVNQTLIATNMIGVCEALLYAYRADLNIDTVLKSVSSGAAGSWSLSNLAPRIVQNNFDPGFFVEHFVKDLGIALDEARRMQICLPGLALAHQLYVSLIANKMSHLGTQALQIALSKLSGVDWFERQS